MHTFGTEAELLVNGGTGVQILIFFTRVQHCFANLQHESAPVPISREISDFMPCAHGANGVRRPHLKSVPHISRLAHRLLHTANTVYSKSVPPFLVFGPSHCQILATGLYQTRRESISYRKLMPTNDLWLGNVGLWCVVWPTAPRSVTRLDDVWGKKQVWRSCVRTWCLSKANVLHWIMHLWHFWDFSALR